MDAVPVDPESYSGVPYGAPAEHAEERCEYLWSPGVPEEDGRMAVGGHATVIGSGEGYLGRSMLRAILASERPTRLSDVANEIRVTQELLNRLGQGDDAWPIFHLTGHGGPASWFGSPDVLVCQSSRIAAAMEYSWLLDHPDDALDNGGKAHQRPADRVTDEEAGAHWRALPMYVQRPWALETCCVAFAAPSASSMVRSAPTGAVAPEDECGFILLRIVAEYPTPPCIGFRITVQSRWLVSDYREGLRRFLGGVLALLRLMIVTLLAALSHQAQTPIFLLIVIATTRHYGRRGDSDGRFLPAPALQPRRSRGVVCLAA